MSQISYSDEDTPLSQHSGSDDQDDLDLDPGYDSSEPDEEEYYDQKPLYGQDDVKIKDESSLKIEKYQVKEGLDFPNELRQDSSSESEDLIELGETEVALESLKPRTDSLPKQVQLAREDCRTSNILNKYEYTKLLGLRARQIGRCSAIYIELSREEMVALSPLEIAELEYRQKVMPLMIKRTHPDGAFELWDVNQTIGHHQLNQEEIDFDEPPKEEEQAQAIVATSHD